MNKIGVVRALTLLLSAFAAVSPIIYGLGIHGWNIQAMLTPLYSPPKIDFRLEPSGLRFDGRYLYAEFKLTNLEEVKVVFEGFNGESYGPDGKVLAPTTLDKAITSPPGSTETLTLKVEVGEAALSRLTSYFMEGKDRISIEVRGEAVIRVFGSKVTAPISSSFEISLADILKR